MKAFKTILIILVLGSLTLVMFGCGSSSKTASAESQIAKVKQGNLTLDITAAGNLALSRTEDLAVDLFYPTGTKGTIESVLVEEGDSVKEGQVLVTLDTSEWDDQLKIVKKALDTALRNVITQKGLVTDAELDVATLKSKVTTKENDVTKAELQVETDELAVKKAELDVQTANNTLMNIMEVKKAQDAIDDDNQTLEFITQILAGVTGGGLEIAPNSLEYWTNLRTATKQDLVVAKEALQDILEGKDLSIDTDITLQIAQQRYQIDKNKLSIKSAQITLEEDKLAVGDSRLAIDIAKHDFEKAQQDLENAKLDLTNAQTTADDAQKNYDEAKSMSPEIKAPFDGFITKVNVAGGDEVLKGTVAVQIADPNKFEAEILVSEMDISQVKLDSEATVSADAMPGLPFAAKVTHIAPTATIQSGVVNYTVKVELEALQAISQNQTTPATANATAGTLPPMLQRAVDSGRMTQEQAEEIVKNGPPTDLALPEGFTPPEDFTPPEGFTLPEGMEFPDMSGSKAKSQISSTTSQDFELREGLTVTVNIIVASRTNVLLVPNAAVTKEGLQSYVQVVSESGAAEKRAVKTGISDWQYTEITDGLTEGEQVIVPQTTSSSTSSSTQRGGMGLFGGPGG